MQMQDVQKIRKELKDRKALLQCAEEFNVLGDPTRLKICYLLCHYKELSVGEIAEIVGVSISAVSHTFNKLKKANIVEYRRDFRTVYYKLKKSPIAKVIKNRINHYLPRYKKATGVSPWMNRVLGKNIDKMPRA